MTMEVKVYFRKKKSGKTRQIDHIPKCFQLPRSASTSKPRTEFFFPICSPKDMSDGTIRHTIDPSTTKFIEPENIRNNEDRNDALELTPNESQLTESSEVCRTPGSVKTEGQIERDNSSSSGRARSKRERKPKVHFDEVSCPLYTSRKVRRFKIMRSLGLAAPVGSPFNLS